MTLNLVNVVENCVAEYEISLVGRVCVKIKVHKQSLVFAVVLTNFHD